MPPIEISLAKFAVFAGPVKTGTPAKNAISTTYVQAAVMRIDQSSSGESMAAELISSGKTISSHTFDRLPEGPARARANFKITAKDNRAMFRWAESNSTESLFQISAFTPQSIETIVDIFQPFFVIAGRSTTTTTTTGDDPAAVPKLTVIDPKKKGEHINSLRDASIPAPQASSQAQPQALQSLATANQESIHSSGSNGDSSANRTVQQLDGSSRIRIAAEPAPEPSMESHHQQIFETSRTTNTELQASSFAGFASTPAATPQSLDQSQDLMQSERSQFASSQARDDAFRHHTSLHQDCADRSQPSSASQAYLTDPSARTAFDLKDTPLLQGLLHPQTKQYPPQQYVPIAHDQGQYPLNPIVQVSQAPELTLPDLMNLDSDSQKSALNRHPPLSMMQELIEPSYAYDSLEGEVPYPTSTELGLQNDPTSIGNQDFCGVYDMDDEQLERMFDEVLLERGFGHLCARLDMLMARRGDVDQYTDADDDWL